jgi:lipopolysaccharide cholinephosphotransferase
MEELIRPEIVDGWGIKKLQNCILNIAQYIDEFCLKNNIDYCLMGGSALGAVRHNGFIPWDDDLDIFMTPDNYEKFRVLFAEKGDKNHYYLQELGAAKGMVITAKVRLNQSTYIEEITKDWDIHHGVFVDIFILHSCPDNTIKRYWQYFWAKYLILKGLANKEYGRRSGVVNLVVKMFKVLPKRFLLSYGLKQVYRFRNEKTEYLCNFLGKALMKNGRYKSSYFETTKRHQFETIELNVAGKVEEFLKDRFGNYMEIPDINSIRYEQHALEWDVDKPFQPRRNGMFADEEYLF